MSLTRTTGWIAVLLTLTLVGCQAPGGPGVGGTGVGTATAIGGLGGAAAGGLLGAALAQLPQLIEPHRPIPGSLRA